MRMFQTRAGFHFKAEPAEFFRPGGVRGGQHFQGRPFSALPVFCLIDDARSTAADDLPQAPIAAIHRRKHRLGDVIPHIPIPLQRRGEQAGRTDGIATYRIDGGSATVAGIGWNAHGLYHMDERSDARSFQLSAQRGDQMPQFIVHLRGGTDGAGDLGAQQLAEALADLVDGGFHGGFG